MRSIASSRNSITSFESAIENVSESETESLLAQPANGAGTSNASNADWNYYFVQREHTTMPGGEANSNLAKSTLIDIIPHGAQESNFSSMPIGVSARCFRISLASL